MVDPKIIGQVAGHGMFHSSETDTDVEANGYDIGSERRKESVQKRLTLTFKAVDVRVTAPEQALGETLWSRADPRQLLDLFRRGEHPKRVR